MWTLAARQHTFRSQSHGGELVSKLSTLLSQMLNSHHETGSVASQLHMRANMNFSRHPTLRYWLGRFNSSRKMPFGVVEWQGVSPRIAESSTKRQIQRLSHVQQPSAVHYAVSEHGCRDRKNGGGFRSMSVAEVTYTVNSVARRSRTAGKGKTHCGLAVWQEWSINQVFIRRRSAEQDRKKEKRIRSLWLGGGARVKYRIRTSGEALVNKIDRLLEEEEEQFYHPDVCGRGTLDSVASGARLQKSTDFLVVCSSAEQSKLQLE